MATVMTFFYRLQLRTWLKRTLLLGKEALETIEWAGIAAVLLITAFIAYQILGTQIAQTVARVISYLR